MALRRAPIGWLTAAPLAAALAVGGCSGAAPGGVPSVDVPASISASGLEGFCAEFTAELGRDWPDIDTATAAALGTVFEEWTSNADLAPIADDVRTLGTWLASMAQSGSVGSPPPDVSTAFDDIRSFADDNC